VQAIRKQPVFTVMYLMTNLEEEEDTILEQLNRLDSLGIIATVQIEGKPFWMYSSFLHILATVVGPI